MENQKLYEFTPETLRKLQLKELDTLVYFKEFCDKNNLLFYLCGGCCIGSLRTGGFIPWDDDIDILMPRDDYEKLYKLWDNDKHERFKLLRTDEKIFTGNIFTTIVDTETTCVKANQAHLDIPFGIMMDIFPIDGCPKGKFKRTMQKLNAMIYSLFLAQIVPENHGGIMALGSKFLLSIVKSPKAREKKWRNAERRMSKYKIADCEYITELCEGVHSMQPEYPKEWFASAVYREFEGLQMPIPVGYDPYLKKAFGDYMTLPPEDKQKPHHDMILVDTERSYKEVLKGKKPSELL
ncbi:2-C-methyl-D-erythritol 4-phosphate cytidylyltransferase [Clostridium sp. AM09-51]|uniref:LicD family protein n=1 Tax=Pseudoruminococcus massiliensis TaxID=2086583 RepID=UPI000E5194B4|nr:LicD family protein [Pseudoruminococcus massiliensis]RHO48097.1 2-C-methyl-D-erythritol 4-phosphate cytidylyltransferase [Clostridium sp. AM09-51]